MSVDKTEDKSHIVITSSGMFSPEASQERKAGFVKKGSTEGVSELSPNQKLAIMAGHFSYSIHRNPSGRRREAEYTEVRDLTYTLEIRNLVSGNGDTLLLPLPEMHEYGYNLVHDISGFQFISGESPPECEVEDPVIAFTLNSGGGLMITAFEEDIHYSYEREERWLPSIDVDIVCNGNSGLIDGEFDGNAIVGFSNAKLGRNKFEESKEITRSDDPCMVNEDAAGVNEKTNIAAVVDGMGGCPAGHSMSSFFVNYVVNSEEPLFMLIQGMLKQFILEIGR